MNWLPIIEAIQGNKRFIIATHIYPDGDGIGSATALMELLRIYRKECRFISDSPIPKKYSFLNYHQNFYVFDPDNTDLSNIDVCFILDTGQPDRIGRLAQLLDRKDVTTICIDHHPYESSFTDIEYIDSTACATGALIHQLFKECGQPLNLAAATGIYVSILCDTSRFSNSCSDRAAHIIAEECIRCGVDPDKLYAQVFQHIPLSEIRIFAAALKRMETHLEDKILVQEIRHEDLILAGVGEAELEHLDLDYILDFDKAIREVECIVLLRELPQGQVRISLRSKGEFDVRSVVKNLGGGGHSNAAGAIIQGSVEYAKSLVISMLEKSYLEQNCIAFTRSVQ